MYTLLRIGPKCHLIPSSFAIGVFMPPLPDINCIYSIIGQRNITCIFHNQQIDGIVTKSSAAEITPPVKRSSTDDDLSLTKIVPASNWTATQSQIF